MYHIRLPYYGPFDSDVDIYVPYGLDLDFVLSLFSLSDQIHEYDIEYLTKAFFDSSCGGNENVDR